MNYQVLIASFVIALILLATYIGKIGKITFASLTSAAFVSVFTVFVFLCQQLRNGCLGSCNFVVFIPWAMFIGAALMFYEIWQFE